MATNLTPAQLAELQRLFSTPVESGDSNAYAPNTVNYDGKSWKKDAAGGFASTGPLYGNNEYHYTNFDPTGAQTAEGDARMSDWDPLTYALMATAGLVGGGLMMGGPGAFGFGANPGYGMVGGATEPVSALSASGGAGLLGRALGIGSTLLGAAAGAKGQEGSTTTTKDLPEYMKPYITGENGLLAQTQQQLLGSRSPERMAQWDQMRNIGMGLLNQPIAGNPTTGWTFNR